MLGKIKLSDLVERLDEDRCRLLALRLLFPDGPACPHCDAAVDPSKHDRFYRLDRCFCSSCSRRFYATSRTPLSSMKISFRELILLNVLIGLQVRPIDIINGLDRCKDSISRWKRIFRSGI